MSAFRPFRDLATIPDGALATSPGGGSFSPARETLRNATSDLLTLYHICNSDFRFLESIPRRCLTRPSQPMHNNDYDNSLHDYILHVHDMLADDRGNQFAVLDLLGTGTFGQVVKCRHQRTGEVVAVKVIKNQPAYFNQAWVEISILRMLHRNNSHDDTRNIVKFYSHFIFRGHLCLVFEKLSINLYELLKQNSYVGVNVDMLRNFVTQILRALNVLLRSEVIHCDLKPENILLKALNSTDLKLIDFGSACQFHYPVYSYVQSRFYRSPEVLLGLTEYDSKIDMWSLGCVAGELFLGIPLFPGQNEMNMISRIIEMLGDMPDRFLRRCRHTHKFFNYPHGSEFGEDMHMYQLKPSSQYEQENRVALPEWKRFFKERKLRDIIMTFPHRTPEPHSEEIAMRESLIDLLSGMLKVDPRERWTPAEALQHPFIRGRPLLDGQPWHPPSRPRRVMRSRPVAIEVVTNENSAPTDGTYSASAPNFTENGRLAMNTTWGGGAGGQAPGIANNGLLQPPHFVPPYSYGTGSDIKNTGPLQSFAPGSYIPSSTFSMYGCDAMHVGHKRGSFGNSGRYAGPDSYGPRAVLYNSAQQKADSQTHGISNVTDSPGGVTIGGSTPPRSYIAAPMKLGGGLDMSGSRESFSESLRLSGSRESIGMGRVLSEGDMGEEAMFAFGSDDEAFSPLQAATSPQVSSHHSIGIGTITGVGTGTPMSPNGASAALPPTRPRVFQGRAGPAAYGQPSTLSYGYTFASHLQTRPLQSTSSLPRQSGIYMNMSDMQPGQSPRTQHRDGSMERG